MDELIDYSFDDELMDNIPHLKNYPELLPFVGKSWKKSNKIMLLGESHYLPFEEIKDYCDYDYFNNWYSGKSKNLEDWHRNYLKTRNNIINLEEGNFSKPLVMYFNLKKALLETKTYNNSKVVFDHFSYFNYFQKPALIYEVANENRSIEPNDEDKEMAYTTLVKVAEIIEPKKIIFVSVKSYEAFKLKTYLNGKNFDKISIDFVPHAGRPWWNKEAKRYENRTGKQKFIDLINKSRLSIK